MTPRASASAALAAGMCLLAAEPAGAAGMPGSTPAWERLEEAERGGRRPRRGGPPRAAHPAAATVPPPSPAAAAPPVRKDDDDDEVATASSSPWTVGGELDLNSRYLWRGIALSSGPVVQPTAYLDWRGLTGAVWLNVGLSSEGGSPLSTVVPTLSYLYERGDVSVGGEAAWIWDTGDAEGNPTAVTLGAEATWSPGILALFTGHYVNVATAPGAYWGEAGLGVAVEAEPWALAVDLEVGVGSAPFRALYLDALPLALVVVTGSLRLAYALGEHLSAALHAEAYQVVSPTASPDIEHLLANIGLTLGVEY